ADEELGPDQVVGAQLVEDGDEPVKDPGSDPADVLGRVNGRRHQPDAEDRGSRRGVGPDLLVERQQLLAEKGSGGTADKGGAHEDHHDGQQQPSHGATLYARAGSGTALTILLLAPESSTDK